MYYPYLRARRFELISLRDLSSANILADTIVPIIEPVRETFKDLDSASDVLLANDDDAFLIVNPIVGDYPGDTDYFLEYLSVRDNNFSVAFHYQQNAEYILEKIGDYGLSGCMIICYGNIQDNQTLRDLCNDDRITHIVIDEPQGYRALDDFLKKLGKIYIRLDNQFERQQRNTDFLEIGAHKFTEEHLYYLEEGYSGFSDFAPLPSDYIDGGSTPKAVVIHLTYLNPDEDNEIWIRHFTSEIDIDTNVNVQGKFAQAAQKAIDFCDEMGIDNSAITELRTYLDEERYPGLGVVKKISIKNHLCVVESFLRE